MTILMVLAFWTWILAKRKSRKGTWWNINGPLVFQTLALFLVPIVPIWKTGADMGWANKWGVWRDGCDGGMACLSFWGWVATVGGTWFGNLCMAIAMGWQLDFMKKLKSRIKKAKRTGK